MANKLFSLFEDKLRTPQDLVASTPQNLQSIGQQVEDPTAILRMIQQFDVVRPKADYTDFKNFVFFNSALDYFNLTGEKILNSYPYDGTSPDLQFWLNSLDEYQRYVVDVWPSNTGHLRFNPTNGFAYVLVDDISRTNDVTQTSLLSPGTGSLSIELWTVPPPALTGSNDVMVVAQKVTGSGDGYTVFYSGSNIFFSTTSGNLSFSDTLSVPAVPGVPAYFCFSLDRTVSPSVISAFSGSSGSFPVLASYLTSSIAGPLLAGTSRFSIASGSRSGKVTRPLTGSLDDIRVWSIPLGLSQITSSFNTRIMAQDGLISLWRFNETGSLLPGQREVALDSSGFRLNGLVKNYYPALRGSGSLLPFDEQDLVLSLDEPAVATYIATQQLSGTIYDRYNDNIITRMMPEQFFLLEEFKNTTVLQDFLYVLARYFDELKVMIDQFANVLKNDYGKVNNTPDALLQDIGKFFGWEFTGTFLNSDAIQYILGKQVLPNLDYNRTIDTKLFEIKNEFWKRTLVNLMHLYKTKGTRESVESIMRIYGANKNFIRLKEYGYKLNSGIQTNRISAEKSVYAVQFSGSAVITSPFFSSSAQTVEVRVKFPTDTSTDLVATVQTGSIWSSFDGVNPVHELKYMKPGIFSMTGTLRYTGAEGVVTLSSAPIFDNNWYDIAVVRDNVSGSVTIDVRQLDVDEISLHLTSSLVTAVSNAVDTRHFNIGSDGLPSEMWAQEFRVWSEVLSNQELNDHALNFQSYGADSSTEDNTLALHWRLNQNLSADGGGNINSYEDFSQNNLNGTGSSFVPNVSPSVKFLLDYNYIAPPEYGWTEEKVRSFDSTFVKPEDAFQDSPLLALEFNLTDALNEDISQIISTLDSFDQYIGAPVHAYRDTYHDLSLLRRDYFKRLRGTVNFRVFADMLEFFDRSFVDLVKKLVPARATFLGDEFVVESHMLERPKVQWNYRRRDADFEPEGVITVYVRT